MRVKLRPEHADDSAFAAELACQPGSDYITDAWRAEPIEHVVVIRPLGSYLPGRLRAAFAAWPGVRGAGNEGTEFFASAMPQIGADWCTWWSGDHYWCETIRHDLAEVLLCLAAAADPEAYELDCLADLLDTLVGASEAPGAPELSRAVEAAATLITGQRLDESADPRDVAVQAIAATAPRS